jgi:hypothetical protein
MARDLNRMYVSYFKRTLDLSVYPACGIHGLLPEDKEIPDISIAECRQGFIKRTENLMRHAYRKASADPEIKKTKGIISEYLKEALPVDWSDRKAMGALCEKTLAVQALLERRLNDRNFRYAYDFREAIIASVWDAYFAHLRIKDAMANPPKSSNFEYSLERQTEAERSVEKKWKEQVKKQSGLATKKAFENKISLMETIIASSRQELERNMEALAKKYGSENIDQSLKEHTDSFLERMLYADWNDGGQTETLYRQTLSEADWLNKRLETL